MATKTIFGTVKGDGTIVSGTGFIIQKRETGIFLIDFETPFSNTPAIVGSHSGLGDINQNTLDNVVFPFLDRGTATAKVGNGAGGPIDFQFSFIAIGQE